MHVAAATDNLMGKNRRTSGESGNVRFRCKAEPSAFRIEKPLRAQSRQSNLTFTVDGKWLAVKHE